MDAEQVIELARKHVKNNVPMRTSAQFCLDDAMNLADSGMSEHAKRRAIKSLGYSVGIFHSDYQKAIA